MEYESDKWVLSTKALEKFNQERKCVCGRDLSDEIRMGRFNSEYIWCKECHRMYAMDGDRAVKPEYHLKTDKGGLVPLTEANEKAFSFLVEISDIEGRRMSDYIESHPLYSSIYDAFLYAHDGLFVGYICYGDGNLTSVFILKEYRDQGLGTRMVEEWYEQNDLGKVEVAAYEGTEPFYRQLSFPVEL